MVRNVGTSRLGGNVVWVWDPERRHSVYYAHLDRQLAEPGSYVQAGDTIGLVGNTGNARTTPPHLHFGIYRRGRGAVDPWPFVRRVRGQPAPIGADTGALGGWLRVVGADRSLRSSPDVREGGRPLPARTVVRALGAAGGAYRVQLPNGTEGWLAAAAAERAVQPLGSVRASVVRERASAPALAVDSFPSARTLAVLGRFGDALLVRAPGGSVGWVSEGSSAD